jgi:hypothetical protein
MVRMSFAAEADAPGAIARTIQRNDLRQPAAVSSAKHPQRKSAASSGEARIVRGRRSQPARAEGRSVTDRSPRPP